MIVTILAFIFVFGVLVFIHELGHFLAAKKMGVRVDEFAFGFPPKIWSWKKGNTTYAINAIPIGGFVKLYGEEGEGAKKQDSLASKKPWQKTVVFAAGVAMNLALAWILLVIFYLVGGKPLIPAMGDFRQIKNTQTVTISEVAAGSPAEKNGVKSGQTVKLINQKEIHTTGDVYEAIRAGADDNGNKSVLVTVIENGTEQTKKITTYKDEIESGGQKTTVNRIGIVMTETGKIQSAWWAAPWIALKETGKIIELNIVGMFNFFKGIILGGHLSKDVGGPVAIAQLSGGAARLGVIVLIQFIAVLSIAVAILNILPFPALDGGHIAFIGIEKIMRREVPARIKNTINWAGFGLLLLLMAVVTVNDLVRIGLIDKIKGLF